jgi:hypothetical protein
MNSFLRVLAEWSEGNRDDPALRSVTRREVPKKEKHRMDWLRPTEQCKPTVQAVCLQNSWPTSEFIYPEAITAVSSHFYVIALTDNKATFPHDSWWVLLVLPSYRLHRSTKCSMAP